MKDTLSSLVRFYTDFVLERAVNMSATDEIKKILETIEEEEQRAYYYIHSQKNRDEYIKNLNNCLIELRMDTRLRKHDGFRRYIELYQVKKEEYSKEIIDLWTVYSRVSDKSVKILKEIFS